MAPYSHQLPGLQIKSQPDWAQMQIDLRNGLTRIPVLPLGHDAAYVWIPKNGCTTLKRAWLSSQGHATDDVHKNALDYTRWLDPVEFKNLAQQRTVVAIWRDPIDRFVSACRSHLKVLTTGEIRAKIQLATTGNPKLFQEALESHDRLFKRHRLRSFDDAADPRIVMNRVALQLSDWIACHLDWSHHTIPQVSYLGGDPSPYSTILGMGQIQTLVQHWRDASGRDLDLSPQHVSAERTVDDRWRRLKREDLDVHAMKALKDFYCVDYEFLDLAQSILQPLSL